MTNPGSGPDIRLEDEPAIGFSPTEVPPPEATDPSPGSGLDIRLEDEPALRFTPIPGEAPSP